MKRPFWMHQFVEYVLGVVLVSQGLQSADPALPALLGGLVIVNAATVHGPLSAFSKVPRPLHRLFDLVLLGLVALAALAPGSLVSTSVRVVLVGVTVVYGFVIWRSDYTAKVPRRRRVRPVRSTVAAPRPARPASAVGRGSGNRSEDIGRTAGRAAGRLYNAARQRKRS